MVATPSFDGDTTILTHNMLISFDILEDHPDSSSSSNDFLPVKTHYPAYYLFTVGLLKYFEGLHCQFHQCDTKLSFCSQFKFEIIGKSQMNR